MSAFLSTLLALIFVTSVGADTITVAAASDLSVLQGELGAAFESTHPHTRVRFVSGASGVLAQQIENGAPYDVFLSANAQFVDRLSSSGKMDTSTVESYANGRLGVLWRDGKAHSFSDLAGKEVRMVALANPQLAPYGAAAREALQHAGLWASVQNKVVYGENVRQALQIFDSGNADAVITAASLLQGRQAAPIPADWHSPIVQKGGLVTGSPNAVGGRTFLQFLTSAAGQAIFARFGFSTGTARPVSRPLRKR